MQRGKVKFFNVTKGYGFIREEMTGREIFVHSTGLSDGVELGVDDQVTFDIAPGRKGDMAVNVDKE